VQHRGLSCGTYTLLLRVGHGNLGCTDVHWFRGTRARGQYTSLQQRSRNALWG
jgi:hypothetical protein